MAPTVANAEHAAMTLLESWWTTPEKDAPLPVDPFQLARSLGIAVQKSSRLATEVSGQIVFMDDGAVITVNAADHPNRQRFTCAHEIGHYTRREEAGDDCRFVDYRSTLAGLGMDQEEIYANQFAAALLMPAHLVKQFVKKQMRVDNMATLFGTSVQAMELRLRNLRLG